MDVSGWSLHALRGDLQGIWAVKVSGNWRLTLVLDDQGATEVDYQDYHQERAMMMHDPAHPGMLIADILENGELSIGKNISALARHLGVTRAMLSRVIHGRSSVTAEMALRLEDALGVKADMWLRLQVQRDLWVASQKKRITVGSLVSLEKAA